MTTTIPQGTVTFLFTDIEGSTRLWESHADWMRAAFARQEALLRGAIADHRGYAYKMIGDSFQVAFDTAAEALLAALEGQRLLNAEPWGEQTLRVRMALHTGVTQERGDDYVGPALNRVARLMAVAHGGQVLLSHATTELVADNLPPEVTLRDMGEHRLKDLLRTEHIYQLIGPGLTANFPPLKTIDSFPHNLPAQLTSFVGREKELAEIKRLLFCERMVTLAGPGGSGKTRLALDVAGELLKDQADGAWFVDLSLQTGSNMVLPAIASVFGLQESSGQSFSDTLVIYLKPRQCLIVLDNCEHLLEGAAQASSLLLSTCPQVRILATSREPLHIPGEWTWPVLPLSLPPVLGVAGSDPNNPNALNRLGMHSLANYEAVRLFVERAQAVMPSFQLTPENALLVARICCWLDGIPLAIELAAARVRMLSVGIIAGRLDRSLELLTGGSRVAQARQQTLRAAIDWSYNLLEPDEQAMFRRLAVFSGGFMLEAMEEVCCCSCDPAMVLMQLVDKSLVVIEELEESGVFFLSGDNGGYIGSRRYRLLETVREYALERLQSSGERQEYQRRQVEYFVSVAESHDPELAPLRPDPRPDMLKRELGNLRLALAWCQAQGPAQVELWLRLAGGLWRFWWVSGLQTEGVRWINQALAQEAGSEKIRLRAQARAQALSMHIGDYDHSFHALRETVDQIRQVGDRWNQTPGVHPPDRWEWTAAFALGSLNDLYPSLLYSPERAEIYFEEALRLARQTGQRWLIAFTLCHAVGYGPKSASEAPAFHARDAARMIESLSTARSLDDPWLVAYVLRHYGHFLVISTNLAQARSYCEECLSINRNLGDHLSTAHALLALADITYRQEDYESAACFLEERLALERRVENRFGIPRSLNTLGILSYHQGLLARAQACYEESLALFLEINYPWDTANALVSLGIIALAEGASRLDEARAYLLQGLDLYQQSHDRDELAVTLQTLAVLAVRAGEHRLAARLFAAGEPVGRVPVFGDLYGQVCWLKPEQIQQQVQTARQRLGEAEFNSVWAECTDGAQRRPSLTLEQACELARQAVPALDLTRAGGQISWTAPSLPKALSPDKHLLQPGLVEALTERELEILRSITAGLTNQEIAQALVIDLGTVKSHNTHIFQKLGVKNRTQAIARGRELDLV